MRLLEGGVAHLAGQIESDLRGRSIKLYSPLKSSLSDLVATVLTCRSCNSGDWKAVMPRANCDEKSKERFISRFLSNKQVCPFKIMSSYAFEILQKAGSSGKTVVLMLDQSKIRTEFECLMLSMRIGNRALPIAWKVVKTKGAIGFDVQKELLEQVAAMLPDGLKIILMADRFYGTSSLIELCQNYNWQYRIRLKGNMIFHCNRGQLTGNKAVSMGLKSLEDAKFNNSNVVTNVGILHENGHKEPWLIAMNCSPNEEKTRDYGKRWGIEAMFSDFKSRGFSITNTHLVHEERIERLILILAIALFWAVSTGMQNEGENQKYTKKNKKDP